MTPMPPTQMQSLQFPLQLSSGSVLAQAHLDAEGVFRAAAAALEVELQHGEDWMTVLTGVFGGILAYAPAVSLLPHYGIFNVPRGPCIACSVVPLSSTIQIQSYPRAVVHIDKGPENVEVRCMVRRPRSLDVERVLVLLLDEYGGTIRSVID